MYNRDGAEKGYVVAFTVYTYVASWIMTVGIVFMYLYTRMGQANKSKGKHQDMVWSSVTERQASHIAT